VDIRPLGEEPLTAEDLSFAFETSASAGLISRRELDLTRNLLRLSQTESRELMVPRSQIAALDANAPWDEVASIFSHRPFTRYPVFEGSLDSLTGMVDAKRLLLAEDDAVRAAWRDQVRPSTVLPESVSADVSLETMRRQSSPMAILVDEYGGTAGLLTQFDIVRFLAEGLPEDIPSNDRYVDSWDKVSPLVLSGLVPLSELRELLEIEIPDTDVVTIGGFVTELRQQIPAVRDCVSYENIMFTVLDVDQYRVAQVRMEIDSTPAAPVSAESGTEADR